LSFNLLFERRTFRRAFNVARRLLYPLPEAKERKARIYLREPRLLGASLGASIIGAALPILEERQAISCKKTKWKNPPMTAAPSPWGTAVGPAVILGGDHIFVKRAVTSGVITHHGS